MAEIHLYLSRILYWVHVLHKYTLFSTGCKIREYLSVYTVLALSPGALIFSMHVCIEKIGAPGDELEAMLLSSVAWYCLLLFSLEA